QGGAAKRTSQADPTDHERHAAKRSSPRLLPMAERRRQLVSQLRHELLQCAAQALLPKEYRIDHAWQRAAVYRIRDVRLRKIAVDQPKQSSPPTQPLHPVTSTLQHVVAALEQRLLDQRFLALKVGVETADRQPRAPHHRSDPCPTDPPLTN